MNRKDPIMADDDPIDDLQQTFTMTATMAARFAEQILRARQDDLRQNTDEARQRVDELDRRYEAQAELAEQYYRRATTAEFVRDQSTDDVQRISEGLRQWVEVDGDRFGQYEAALSTVTDLSEHPGGRDPAEDDYDSRAARQRRDQIVDASDLEPEVKVAVKLADRQNAFPVGSFQPADPSTVKVRKGQQVGRERTGSKRAEHGR